MKNLYRFSKPAILSGAIIAMPLWLSACLDTRLFDVLPSVATREDPAQTQWQPNGSFYYSPQELNSNVLSAADRFTALHSGVRSADEITGVYAPKMAAQWTVETSLFLPNGPTFDTQGIAYSVPLFSNNNGDVLIANDAKLGTRLWQIRTSDLGDVNITCNGQSQHTLTADIGQGGAPLILKNPGKGGDMVIAGSFSRVFATDSQGNLLWNTQVSPESFCDNPASAGEGVQLFGLTYQPATDTVIAVFSTGDLVAFDRATGQRVGGYEVPGAPAATGGLDNTLMSGDAINDALSALFQHQFGVNEDVTQLGQILTGGGHKIANFIGLNPDNNSLWVAATSPDADDGTIDGVAEFGALYRIDTQWQTINGVNQITFTPVCQAAFSGGSAATPSIRADGQRIYTADNVGNLLAFNDQCDVVWSVDVGQQIFGSVAVSSTGSEIYAATSDNITKVIENGNTAAIAWQANISSAYQSHLFDDLALFVIDVLSSALSDLLSDNGSVGIGYGNLNLAGLGENGVITQVGYGITAELDSGERYLLPFSMAVALLDRETGAVINATPAREETVAVMSSTSDGSVILGNSPVRRLILRALADTVAASLSEDAQASLYQLVPEITGGLTRYSTQQGYTLLARDATCQAQHRIQYGLGLGDSGAKNANFAQATHLLSQAEDALFQTSASGELPPAEQQSLVGSLQATQVLLNNAQWNDSINALIPLCDQLSL